MEPVVGGVGGALYTRLRLWMGLVLVLLESACLCGQNALSRNPKLVPKLPFNWTVIVPYHGSF